MDLRVHSEIRYEISFALNETDFTRLKNILKTASNHLVMGPEDHEFLNNVLFLLGGNKYEKVADLLDDLILSDDDVPVEFDGPDADPKGNVDLTDGASYGPISSTDSEGPVDKPHSCACGAISSTDQHGNRPSDAFTSDTTDKLAKMANILRNGRVNQEPEDFDKSAQRSAISEWNKGNR